MARKSTKKEDILDNSKVGETVVEVADEKKGIDEQATESIEENVAAEPKDEPIADVVANESKDASEESNENETPSATTYHRSKTFGYSWNGVEMDF